MGFIGTLFDAIKDFYRWPFHQYKFNNFCDDYFEKCVHERDWWMTAVITIIVIGATLFVLLMLTLIGAQLYDKYRWYRDRQRCQHCEKWTLWTSSGEYPGCLADHACCDDCNMEHQAQAEEQIHCPNATCHGQIMRKIISDDLIYDGCDNCGTIVLGSGELNFLEKRAYREGYSDGRAAGTASGVVIGTVIS